MDFYLIDDKKLEFKNTVKTIKPGVFKITSAPVEIDLQPTVKNNDDAYDYCKALANSLVENAQEWKNLKDRSKIASTLKVALTVSAAAVATDVPQPGCIRIYADEKEGVANRSDVDGVSVLKRLRAVYGQDNVKINAFVKDFIVDRNPAKGHFDFEAKDLVIRTLKKGGGDDKDESDDDEDEGALNFCESAEVPVWIWAPWRETTLAQARLTVTVTLSDASVSKLYLEDVFKLSLVAKNKVLLEEAICSDLVIVADNGGEVKCHKAMLAVSSDVFRAMFESEMKENIKNRLEMPDMSEPGIRAFLAYIYYWTVDGASESCEVALELLRAGHKYAIRKLFWAMSALLCAKPEKWFTVDVSVKLLLFSRNLDKEDDDDKEKFQDTAVHVLHWYNKASSENLKGSEEYRRLFKENPEVAMELSSLFLNF